MDAEDWDARYAGSDLIWSAAPNTFVVEHVAHLLPGRALDVACGEGRNALWLAEQGWDVVGIDFSEVGIAKARRIAEHRGVDVDWRVGDVTDPSVITGAFDLVLVAYLQLPRPALDGVLGHLTDRVLPGGHLLVVGHHVDNVARGYGGPSDPGVLHDPDHVATLVAGAGLVVEEAKEVQRTVETDEGDRTAVDSLVFAGRPGGGSS